MWTLWSWLQGPSGRLFSLFRCVSEPAAYTRSVSKQDTRSLARLCRPNDIFPDNSSSIRQPFWRKFRGSFAVNAAEGRQGGNRGHLRSRSASASDVVPAGALRLNREPIER